MHKSRSPIKVIVAILLVLAIVFLVAQCQADDGDCSTGSLGTTAMAPAAFSASKPVGKGGGKSSSSKGSGKKSKDDGHYGGFFSLPVFHIFHDHDHDCD
ncbi:hypothetical protein ITI46_33765 [Streptomyces oryzae]|uniref:Uncharacterized protein n=1 Tax=Streptomyces oryzae TaxID=1434886 RepID=A0ABS3XMC3_9ACTN|nr:hypothetical protein [Streptomyces oryzae]MBO8196562.1 hypothetical protein [Streptomyces oryzae]